MQAKIQPLIIVAGFSLLLLAASERSRASDKSNDQDGGVLEGVVTFRGAVPRARIADNAGKRRALLTVDRKTCGLRYVVVYLQPQKHDVQGLEKSKEGDKLPSVVVDQLEHTFVPHLIAIRGGQAVRFTNSDSANHNVRAAALDEKNQFNVFTGAGGEYQHRFRADPKGRPVLLACDIHPWMRAWIYVFDHPYFATTDEQGRFTIRGVQPGEYTYVVRQPDVGYTETRTVVVTSGKSTRVDVEIDSTKGKAP